MVATGHPINEGELEVAAAEDEACLGACAVAPAPQVPRGLECEAGILAQLDRDIVEQLVLRGVAGGDPPTKSDIAACEKRRIARRNIVELQKLKSGATKPVHKNPCVCEFSRTGQHPACTNSAAHERCALTPSLAPSSAS